MTSSPHFVGKTAVVSGAGRGIGRSTAIALALQGARVVLLARTSSELDDVVRDIHVRGGDALAMPTDVGDPVAIGTTARRIMDDVGGADILVNNAAVVWPLGPSVSLEVAEWTKALEVNLVGAVTLTLALLPEMLKRRWGRIINVSSGIAARPDAMIGANAYATSKAALEAHTLNLAAELVDTGVTVNVYRPGTVDTQMQAWIRSQTGSAVVEVLRDRFVESYENGALITPDASANSLVSHSLTNATGEIWNVDLS